MLLIYLIYLSSISCWRFGEDEFDARLLAKKITIITSNFKIETLKSDDRIINRISEMTIPLEFPAESVRLTLANESNQKYKNLLLK